MQGAATQGHSTVQDLIRLSRFAFPLCLVLFFCLHLRNSVQILVAHMLFASNLPLSWVESQASHQLLMGLTLDYCAMLEDTVDRPAGEEVLFPLCYT